MAAKLSFQLEAGKILAKLHRGACMTHPDVLFFNTGVLNDQEIAPEDVDGQNINFDIVESGQYELGVILNSKSIVKLGDSIQAIMDRFQKLAEEADKNNEKNAKTDAGKEGKEDDTGKEGDSSKEGDSGKEGDSTSINQPPEGAVNEDYTETNPKNVISPEALMDCIVASAMGEATPEEIAKIADEAPADVVKALKNNQDSIKLFFERNIPVAYKYLKDYMLEFAGKDQAEKITEKDVVVTYVPKAFADPYKNPTYKKHKYQIPAETDENVRKIKVNQLKNPAVKEYELQNVCFKIGYDLTGAK